jgi:alpha-tubulin suppressor-like RCC1 family protein
MKLPLRLLLTLAITAWAVPVQAGAVAAAGASHAAVIDGSGNVWTWGLNTYGQLGNGSIITSTLPVQVTGLSSIIQVAAGANHTLALKSDGTVWAWGYNFYGQLGNGAWGSGADQHTPVEVGTLGNWLTGVSKIAVGDNHSVAWKIDGSVWTWGNNNNGQLGDGTINARNTPAQLSTISGVLTIGAGGSHTLAAMIDGSVKAWGFNNYGQLGNGNTADQHTPVPVSGLSGVSVVVGGENFSLALKSDGTLWSFGTNAKGQLGDETGAQQTTPVRVAYLSGVTDVSAGQYHALAVLNDGTVWGWGLNDYGEIGDGTIVPALGPEWASSLSGAVALAAGANESSVVVTTSGIIWAWGFNASGQVGDGTYLTRLNSVKVTEAGYAWKTGTPVPSVLTGTYSQNQTVTLSSATSGATIRYTTDGTDPTSTSTIYTSALSITGTTTLKAKATSSLLADSNIQTTVYTMKVASPTFSPVGGTYTTAQTVTLATTTPGATIRYTTDGTTPTSSSTAYTSPLLIGTTTTLNGAGFLSGYTASDTATAVYTLNLGTLAAPGMSPGAGTAVGSVTVTVSGPTGATLTYTTDGTDPTAAATVYTAPITLTATTTLKAKAFKTDWTPSATTTTVYTIQVVGPTFSLAAGQYPVGQTVTLSCTTPGATIYYTLDGTTPTQSSPSTPSGGILFLGNYTLKAQGWATGLSPSSVTSAAYTISGTVGGGAVAAGLYHGLVLKTDGTVWAWGFNDYGQVGDGTTTPRASPVQLSGLTGITAIAAGQYHSLAVKSDGSVWAWGRNNHGQIGNGTTTDQHTPLKVSAHNVVFSAVAAGQFHSLAVKSGGTVWAWGYNNYGQLGNGNTTEQHAAVQVSGLTGETATTIASGVNYGFARTSDGKLWAWGYNGNGQLGDSTYANRSAAVQVTSLGTSVSAISAGTYDSLGAKSDGSGWWWGYIQGTATPASQAGLSGMTKGAVGYNHFLALESDWAVWAWGYNESGQLGSATPSFTSSPLLVTGLPGVVSISAGTSFSLALGQDGSVWAWGLNTSNQLGDGTSLSRTSPVKVAEPGFAWKVATPVLSPAGGPYTSSQSVSITTATTGATIHYTTDGSTPTTSSPVYSSPVAVGVTTTLQAKAMKTLLSDSNVASGVYTLTVPTPTISPNLGSNYTAPQTATISCSQTGVTIHYTTTGNDPTTSDPTIASGGTLAVNLTLTLKAKAWLTGWTTSAVGSAPFNFKVSTPSLSPAGGVFTAPTVVTVTTASPGATIHYTMSGLEPTEDDQVVASGSTVTVAPSATLKAKAFVAGWTVSDTAAATYVLSRGTAASPTFTPAGGTYTATQTVVLLSTTPGAVIRYTVDGADPTPFSPVFPAPIPISATTTLKARAYAVDFTPSAVVNAVYQMNLGLVEAPTLSVPAGLYATSQTVTISTTTQGATIHYTTTDNDPTTSDPTITSGGTLLVDRAMIVKAAAWMTGMTQSAVTRRDYVVSGAVAAGSAFTLGLKTDGSVWGWGDNYYGQLGDGTSFNQRTLPVQVVGPAGVGWLTGVGVLAAGQYHSLAVKSDGTVWAWGYNYYGQLGNGASGSGADQHTPVQVVGAAGVGWLTGVVAVAAGQSYSLAVKSDGTVWAWGLNNYGQLGNGASGSGADQHTPVQVGTLGNWLTGAVAVAAGVDHSLALKSDTTLVAWGNNNSGQLGDGTNTQRLTPVPVSNLSGISKIVAGNQFSLALRTSGASSGTVWSWGYNANGQLGDGTIAARNALVEGTPSVMTVAAGDHHSLASRADGTTADWGGNDSSQLGIGGTTQRNSAVLVAGATEFLQVAAGSRHSVGLRADGTIWAWGSNSNGQLGDGSGQTQPRPVQVGSLTLASNSWMNQDPDGDGLLNAGEYRLGADPLNPDTNQDGVKDGTAVAMGISVTNPDMDGDGLLNGTELQIGTNPFVADTDGDGVIDSLDCFPLDPTQWQCTPNPNDHTPPVITIDEPPGAVPVP